MDEVLCNISPRCVDFLYENRELFGKYFKLDKPYTRDEVLQREEYYLDKWLKRDDVESVPKDIFEIYMYIYSRQDFYEPIPPTKLAAGLRMFVANKKVCKKLIICSSVLTDKQVDAKLRWLNNFFCQYSSQIEFLPVYPNQKKSKIIMDEGIKWDVFIDDSLDNIYDMVLYAQGLGNEIIVPKMGYNRPTARLMNMINKWNLQYYEVENTDYIGKKHIPIKTI
jgi:hypothetical protein